MSQPPNRLLDVAFAQLQQAVEALTHGEYVPSAAAVKSLLLRDVAGFDERNLGFRKFVEFLEAATENGVISMSRDANNHPRVFPTTVEPAKVQAVVKFAATLNGRRLRREVWRAFVDWEPQDYWRGWDRTFRRVFLAPYAGGGSAPWEVAGDRFVAIPTILSEQQFEWMREFSAAQSPEHRAPLVAAVAPDAPARAFKTTLSEFDLTREWTTALQQHVNLYVGEWARGADVSIRHLFEPVGRSPRASAEEQARVVPLLQHPAPSDARTPREPEPSAPGSDVDLLRARMREVLDGLNLSELSQLPVPARFLLHW